MKTRNTTLTLSALLAFVIGQGAANAAHPWMSGRGASCQSADPVNSGWLSLDYRGAGNGLDLELVAQCPVAVPWGTFQMLEAVVYLDDRSTVHPFFCSMFTLAVDGSASWSPNKWTCASTGGGCTTSSNLGFTGPTTLTYSSLAAHSGSPQIAQAGVSCNMPGNTSGSLSWVRGLRARYWKP